MKNSRNSLLRAGCFLWVFGVLRIGKEGWKIGQNASKQRFSLMTVLI